MQTNTAESFARTNDRKLNGPNGFKTSAMTTFDDETGAYVRTYKTYWRVATSYAPGFCLRVNYHG